MAEGYSFIIGCDEVGRGCLAGPVVASAVVLPVESHQVYKVIKDSKLLAPKRREELSGLIRSFALGWGIGVVDEKTIDVINIHHASLLAMRRAVEGLINKIFNVTPLSFRMPAHPHEESLSLESDPSPDRAGARDDKIMVAIDGKFVIPNVNFVQEAIVSGDAKILSIAAASIVAKVYRDNLMRRLHKKHPQYNFAQHKGYATLYHRQAIAKFGLSPLHRLSFCEQYIK